MSGLGFTNRVLTDEEIAGLTHEALAKLDIAGKRVLILVPDGTRTAPIPQMFRLFCCELLDKVAKLDFLIALGTHQPMSPEQINKLVGVKPEEWANEFKDVHVYNHEWSKPETFITLGTVSEQEVAEISDGKLCQAVDVRINRLVTQYD